MTIKTINPFNAEIIKEYNEMSLTQLNSILEKSHQAFLSWRETSFATRAEHMKKIAKVLRDNSKDYAKLMTLEMGKPIKSAAAEIEKCAWVCEFYAEQAEKFLTPEVISTEAKKSFITFQPLGVVLAVMPWNFPFWQVFRFAAPAIMAGNVGVLKHASNVFGCALAIEEIFKKANFPEFIFQSLLIGSRHVDEVIANPYVAAVTLTGSTHAGSAVASQAGKYIKKTVLELGGSDPYVILADADLEKAAETCVVSRLTNSGQSCIAAKRFIVVKEIKDQFTQHMVKKMQTAVMGDPFLENIQIGPLARHDLRDQLHQQVEKSIAKGAKCLLGGKIPEEKGAFYPPTVLTEVKKGMPAFDEEMFGPVAPIIVAANEKEAIAIANDSPFGLGAAVFTRDAKKGEEIAAKQLQAGFCAVNTMVKSDPRLPFGGIKESGYGRELSHYGIKEFVNIKTVYVGKD